MAAETETKARDGTLTVAVVMADAQLPRPEAVNFFAISRVAGDIQIVTGYVDVNHAATLHQRWQKGEEVPLTLEALPMHRLAVTVGTFEQLKRKVDEIYSALQRDGRLAKTAKAKTEES